MFKKSNKKSFALRQGQLLQTIKIYGPLKGLGHQPLKGIFPFTCLRRRKQRAAMNRSKNLFFFDAILVYYPCDKTLAGSSFTCDQQRIKISRRFTNGSPGPFNVLAGAVKHHINDIICSKFFVPSRLDGRSDYAQDRINRQRFFNEIESA